MVNPGTSEALCSAENAKIQKLFENVNKDCACKGCQRASAGTYPELNFHGELAQRDFPKYIPVLKESIYREEQKLQIMRANLEDSTKQEELVDDLQDELESREQFLEPTLPTPMDTSSYDVPFQLFPEEIGQVSRVINNAKLHSDGFTVVDYAKQDVDKLSADGGLLYKYKSGHFKVENQTTFWKQLSKLKHGDQFRDSGTNSNVIVGITWTRIRMIKEMIYQCDQYTPMLFSHHDGTDEETGELSNLTIGEICKMMDEYFPLCKLNPLKACVQFFSRLRKLCKEKHGEIHIPYIVLGKDLKMAGDASLGFNFSQVPTPLMDVIKKKIEGVNTAYTYIAILGSFFAIHAEDSNLNSMSVHYGGLPKVWFIMNGEQTKVVHAGLHELVKVDAAGAPVKPCIIQHKKTLIDPEMLRRWGAKFKVFVHTPGTVIFTGSGCLHEGVNTGNGVAKAVNLAFADMLQYGTLEARLLSDCSCDDNEKFVMDQQQTDALQDMIIEHVFSKNKFIYKSKENLKRFIEFNKSNLTDMHLCSHQLCKKVLEMFRAAEALSKSISRSATSDEVFNSNNNNASGEKNASDGKAGLGRLSEMEQCEEGESSEGFVAKSNNGNGVDEIAQSQQLTKAFIGLARSLEDAARAKKTGYKTYRRIATTQIIGGRFQCQHCPKTFKLKAYLRLHINKVHLKDPNKRYICEVCGQSFQTENGCRNHVKQTHTGATYPCKSCESVFSNVSARSYHYKTSCIAQRGKPSTPPN